jgi:hypothetical protein
MPDEEKGLPSEHGYKAPWIPMERNEAFWTEVLVGRTITSLTWNETGLEAMILDDGQKVFIIKNQNQEATLCIRD